MNAMSGIERWGGPLALWRLYGMGPGALPQAAMATGLWPCMADILAKGYWPCSANISEILLPPLKTKQRHRRGVIPALASGQGAEAAQMEAVRSLIPVFEAKIQRVLDRVWGSATVG